MNDVTSLSLEQVELMPTSQLVATFNELAPTAGQNPVIRFATRDIGIKRTFQLIEAVRKHAPEPAAEVVRKNGATQTVALKDPRFEGKKPVLDSNIVPLKGKAAELAVAAIEATTPPVVKKGKKAGEPKAKRVTFGSRCRDLIMEGKTNDEIWAVLQPQFNKDDDKKWHVGWYRSELRRRGVYKS